MDNKHIAISLVEKGIKGSIVEMTHFPGGGNHNHIGLIVAAEQFNAKTILEQHQMVMDVLKDELKERLHAIELKTMSIDRYEQLYKKEI